MVRGLFDIVCDNIISKSDMGSFRLSDLSNLFINLGKIISADDVISNNAASNWNTMCCCQHSIIRILQLDPIYSGWQTTYPKQL